MRGILAIFLFVLIVTVTVTYYEYNSFDIESSELKEQYIKEQKEKLIFDTNRVLGFIENEYATRRMAVDRGLLQRQIRNAISQLYGRQDNTGYIFIYDHNGICLSDPVQPYNIGKNLYSFKDPNGVQVIKELIDVSRGADGGFVTYTWVKPTTKERSPKISYARSFEPWKWMIGTGVYIDEADRVIAIKKSKLKEKLIKYLIDIMILMITLFVVGLVGVKIINNIIRLEIKSFGDYFSIASRKHLLIDNDKINFKEFKRMVPYINSMVSEIHIRKEKLKKANKTLQKKVEEKTKNLKEQNILLSKEKKFSDDLLKAQDSFIQHSIHEINTPLAVIMTHIDIYYLRYGNNKYISKIEAGAKMISTLYDDLSYMVKKNRFSYIKKSIDFSEFLEDRIRFFAEIAEGNRHKVIFNIQSDIFIHFSDIQLQRIIDNNLSNAIKYAKKDTDIVINLMQYNSRIELSFITNSHKIEDTNLIFEPFHREDSVVDGFGLGLQIVHSICQTNNIDIDVNSDDIETKFGYTFLA